MYLIGLSVQAILELSEIALCLHLKKLAVRLDFKYFHGFIRVAEKNTHCYKKTTGSF